MGILTRLYRIAFPRLTHPLLDGEEPPLATDAVRARAYASAIRTFEPGAVDDPFVAARYHEGRRWRRVLAHYLGTDRARILDVGGGNGAIELAFGASAAWTAFSVEREWNAATIDAHRSAAAPLRRTIADGDDLPFAAATFDAVLLLETIEHLDDAAAVGREVVRTLRAGGVVLITTPPRWRYAMRPDPHFGIRGLAVLPSSWQRTVAARRGFDAPHHHVERLFGSTHAIARLFPGCVIADVLSRSRAPRRFSWDAVVLRKAHSSDG